MSVYWLMDREVKRAKNVPRAAGAAPQPEEITSDALSRLLGFIPAETISIYIIALSLIPSISGLLPQINAFSVWVCSIIFNLILLSPLIYLATYRKTNPNSWPSQKDWTSSTFLWSLIASTIAFAFWALAMPQSPFVTGINAVLEPVFSLLAVIISVVLSLLDGIINPKAS